ncbi:MAG: hypothetical protein RI924_30 [Bacteroidota bacterium]|jgi:exosortase family protein XrtF
MIWLKPINDIFKFLFKDVKGPVRDFFYRALLLFVIWKTVYLIVFLPNRLLDGPLTNLVGSQTVSILNFSHRTTSFTSSPFVSKKFFEGQLIESNVSRITFNNFKVMHIADGCNGLELFVLYIGFILLLPSTLKRKVLYILSGVIIIHLANLIRCAGLATIEIYIQSYFEFAHHYVFKIIIYGTIFLLWMCYARKLSFKID